MVFRSFPRFLLQNGAVVGFSLLLPAFAQATTYDIYVAPKGSAALTAAEAKANGTTIFAERALHKAIDQAATILNAKGANTVNVLVAGGDQTGKVGMGIWPIPTIKNPNGSLRFLGGWNPQFSARTPFKTISKFITSAGRGGPFMKVGQQSQLKQLVISGFSFDASPSNSYDAKSNSLLRGSSRTFPILAFNQLQTTHLVVADNIFLNGPHSVFEPYIAPVSPDTTVDILNNFFLNNVMATKIGAGIGYRGHTVKTLNLRGNTFLANWPYNPEATSSNVSAVNLYHRDGAQFVNIENNLFAHNPGGAMQHDWPENRMPKMAIRNNLFFKNATLFGHDEPGLGVIAGKFGTNPKYLVLDAATIEDDLGYSVGGNVVLDPKIPVEILLKTGVVDNSEDTWIEGWAPKMTFNPAALPIPANPAAKIYGVQPNSVWAG